MIGFALACGSSGSDNELVCTTSDGVECDPDTFSDTADTCACEEVSADADTGTPDVDPDDTSDPDDTNDPGTDGAAWTANESPCMGSNMDALYCDSATECYVGCGSNADGYGLYETSDGGGSWAIAEDAYSGTFFSGIRVLDIDRDPDDGLLYVSGTGGSYRVVAFNTEDGTLSEVLNHDANVDYSMTVGNYVRRADGLEIAESLTGTGLVVRKNGDAAFLEKYAKHDGWASAYGWWHTTGYSNHVQVLDMEVIDGDVLGVGAQINYPPVVYLPPRDWDFATDEDGDRDQYLEQMFETVQFVDDFDLYVGECWGIDGNDDGLAVVCVNQSVGHGRIYTIGADWRTTAYDPASWTATNVEDHVDAWNVLGHPTWNEGVCRGPDNEITVVGRDSLDDAGYVVRSTDGGATWTEITGDIVAAYGGSFGPATRCAYNDTHLMVGGSGIYAYARISDL